jgi:hypothetical protein
VFLWEQSRGLEGILPSLGMGTDHSVGAVAEH